LKRKAGSRLLSQPAQDNLKQKSTSLSTGAFEKYLEKIIFSFLLLQALSLLLLLPELLS
jgi:hypothetical protein